jgi:hypothetical protein
MDPVELRPNVINGRRVGNQIPGINIIPMHESRDRGDEAIEFLQLIGIDPDPWQEHILRESLNLDNRNKWAATEVGLIVPRQCGKTVIAELRELVGLFVLGEQRLIVLVIKHLLLLCKDTMAAAAEEGLSTAQGCGPWNNPGSIWGPGRPPPIHTLSSL